MAETTTIGNTPEEKATAPVAPSENNNFSTSDEMELNVSMDQLSFICEYCGKVNAISSPNCVRCGKRRPRSEYLNALKKMNEAKSVRSQYIEEQAKLATDRQAAAQEQLVRLVEDRVADEKAQFMAQESVRFEQETDNIKRATARDAVLKIIAAENAADERVRLAEARKEDAIKERDRAAEEIISAEREKVLYAAAKRVVSERAGIENAAEERIIAERKDTERKAEENAARKAVVKIIANEQATEDRARLERDAITRAAIDRIAEERRIAELDALSKYRIEKEAMERAMDERINAEREALNRMRMGAAGVDGQTVGGQSAQSVQPLAIVPYVNSVQPLYQYKNVKRIYKFVPDEYPQQEQPAPAANGYVMPEEKPKANKCVLWVSFISILLGLVLIFVTLMNLKALSFVKYISEGRPRNVDVLFALFKTTRYTNFTKGEELWYIAPVALLVMLVGAVVCIIMDIVALVKNKMGPSFIVYAAVTFVGAAMTIVGLWLAHVYDSLVDCFGSIGLIIILAVSLVILILAIIGFACCRKKKGKARKQVQEPVSDEEQQNQ